MEIYEFVSKHFPLIRKHWFPLSLGALGLIFFAYGLIGLLGANKTNPEDIIFEANSSVKQNSEAKNMLVDIEGAVVKPGVYKLPQESRIQDGLIAAGGLSAQANREYISKNINLATKLTDGAKVYIPALGEAVNTGQVLNTALEGVGVGVLINVNTCSQSQLEALPGIGSVTAQKIIAGRPYGLVSELLDRKVVGSKVFDQIKDKISTY